jgi:hypothetical protein
MSLDGRDCKFVEAPESGFSRENRIERPQSKIVGGPRQT